MAEHPPPPSPPGQPEQPARVGEELGATGLEVWSGYVQEEFLRELQGQRGYKIYREMSLNDAVIGGVLFAIKMLIRSVPWTVQPGGASPLDEQAAEFLRTCKDDMEHTWSEFLDEVLSMLPYGYSYHEVVLKRRLGQAVAPDEPKSNFDDGRIGWKKIPIRSQATIWDWIMSPKGEVLGAYQQAPPMFQRVALPLTRCLLFRPSAHKDNPEGMSILRTAYRAFWFKKNTENMEGIGLERDLVGFPVAWIPRSLFEPGNEEKFQTYKDLVTKMKANEQAGMVMPLEYDANGNKKYDLTLLSVGSRRLFDTGAIVDRWNKQIAMSVLADFILLGQQSVGSYALADSKTKLFATAIGAWLDAIADVLNRTAVPRLFALNPEFASAKLPTFAHDDIETPDLDALGEYIGALSGAGASLFPDKELENYLRRAGGMPEAQEGDVGGDGAPLSEEAEKRAFFAYQLDSGVVTINEARAREGLAPIDGGDVTLPEFRAAHPDWQWSAGPGGGAPAPFTASVRKAILRLPGAGRRSR